MCEANNRVCAPEMAPWSLSGQEWRGYTANLVETILAGNPPWVETIKGEWR